MRCFEAFEDGTQLFANCFGQGLGSMIRQDLAQIVVDSLDQILVWERGSNAKGTWLRNSGSFPVVVSAVFRGVPLCEIVAPQPYGPGDIQCEVFIVDGNPLPHAAEHSGQIVAEQQ